MFVEVSNPTMANIVSTRKKRKKNAEEFPVNEFGEEIHYDKFGDVYYLRRNAKRTKRKQAPTTPLIEWLRQRTSPTIYGTGVMNEDGYHVFPNAIKSKINSHQRLRAEQLRAKEFQEAAILKPKGMPNYRYADHFAGIEKQYFKGNDWCGLSLVYVDLDVQKTLKLGSSAGAEAFSRRIQEFFPAHVHLEASTFGTGRAMYFVLRTGIAGWNTGSPAYANAALRRLDKALKDLQASDRADIENVEIKGLIPEFDWDATHECWQVGNSGTFAKLPRDDEVINTCEISIPQLLAIVGEIERVVLQNPPADPVANKKQHRHGSTEWISEDLFEGLDGLELRIKCRGRRIANGDDLRVVIAYDRFWAQHPNKDGSNPVARAAWFWQQAILLGFTTRSWHPSNFKAVRDHLTNRGCHEWESNEYQFHRGMDGTRLKCGFACKWSVNLARLEQVIEEMRSCGSAARDERLAPPVQ